MAVDITVIMLGVADVARSKTFYVDGLGGEVEQDYRDFVRLDLGKGSSLALYEREAAAQDAGVPAAGSGFRGVSFHHIVDSRQAVDEVMATAAGAGAAVVREASAAQWGGYYGYFSDPDGYLWKVATSS